MATNTPDNPEGATRARTTTATEDHATKESLIGTDRRGRPANVSWGAIFAGVVTFLAVTVLLSVVTAALGLGGSGTGAGIWSVIALALALAAGGYVAGALGVRSGLLHGFLTWATSVVAAVVLAVWLSASALGAIGGVLGQVASTATEAVSGTDVGQAVDEAQENIDQEDVEQAEEQAEEVLDDAQQQAGEIADSAETGAWWTFIGMLLGAVIAALMGMVGARSVTTREDTVRTR